MRPIQLALIPALLCFAPLAHADTTYILTLTPLAGYGGSGSITVDTPPPAASSEYYASPATPGLGTIESLTIDIGGVHFTLADSPSQFAVASFTQNALSQLVFTAEQQNSGIQFLLTSNLNYNFADTTTGQLGRGTISSALATPEPASLLMLGTGALGMCGIARRRLHR